MLADRDIQPAGLDQIQVERQSAERRHPAGCRLGFVLERQRTLCHASVTPLVMAPCFATTAYLLDSSRPTGNLIILDPDLRWVDFRNPADYGESFARLIGGLDGKASGPEPRWDGELEIPDAPAGVASAPPPVASVFRKLDSAAVVMLLIRDGENPGRIADALARRAEPRYPSGHVIPLMPSWTLAAMNPAAFYARLALDAGLDDAVDSRESFHAAAARRLRSGRWCWIVTGFENAPEAEAQYLARAIVEWTDANGEFRIILCGGERLHDLRDANGF